MNKAFKSTVVKSTLQKLQPEVEKSNFAKTFNEVYEKTLSPSLMLNLQLYNTYIIWEGIKDKKETIEFSTHLSSKYFEKFSSNQQTENDYQPKPFLYAPAKLETNYFNKAFEQLPASNTKLNQKVEVYEIPLSRSCYASFQNVNCISDIKTVSSLIKEEKNIYSIGINMSHSIFQNIPHLFNHLNTLKTYRNSGNLLMYEKLLEIAKNDDANEVNKSKNKTLKDEEELECKSLLQTIGELSLNDLYLLSSKDSNVGTLNKHKENNWLILTKTEEQGQLDISLKTSTVKS